MGRGKLKLYSSTAEMEIEKSRALRIQRRYDEKAAVQLDNLNISRQVGLSDKQRMAIDLLSDVSSESLTQKDVAKLVGVAPMTLSKWMNTPEFLDELDREFTKRHTTFRRMALKKLGQLIRSGKWAAIEKYLMSTGDLKDRVVVDDNTQEKFTTQTDRELDDKLEGLFNELKSRKKSDKAINRIQKEVVPSSN